MSGGANNRRIRRGFSISERYGFFKKNIVTHTSYTPELRRSLGPAPLHSWLGRRIESKPKREPE